MTPTTKASPTTKDTPDAEDPQVTSDAPASDVAPDSMAEEVARLREENQQLRGEQETARQAKENPGNFQDVRLVIVHPGVFGSTVNRTIQVPVLDGGELDRDALDQAIGKAFQDGAVNVEEITGTSNVIHHRESFQPVS